MAERPPHEIELKLRVPAHRVAAVEAAVRGRAQTPRVHLQASYVDTPGFDLAANGIGWRIRREGRQWVQTVKAEVAAGGDGMRRFEDNVAIPARERDVVDATRHSEHPAGVRLLEVLEGLDDTPTERFRTDIWRVARVVRVPGGRVELALDRGEIVAGDHRVAVSELEVELVSGAPLAVIETARTWAARHGLWLDTATKAHRGVMLSKGLTEAPIAKAPTPVLTDDMSVDAALREITRACMVQILGNCSAIAAGVGSNEHVHQARVGLRKLRTALRELQDEVPAADRAWPQRLADIFAGLGASRDREVVLAGWLASLDEAGAPDIATPTGPSVDPAELLRGLEFTDLMLDLLAFVHGTAAEADPDRPLRVVVQERLERLRGHSLGKPKKFAGLPIEAQHDVRKDLKRLRYMAELTVALFPKRKVDRYVKALAPAQDALGALNDLVVAGDFFRVMAVTDAPAWFAVGWLASRHDDTVRACVGPLRDAATAKPYW
jgi:inorganic triphosphatase YgiF